MIINTQTAAFYVRVFRVSNDTAHFYLICSSIIQFFYKNILYAYLKKGFPIILLLCKCLNMNIDRLKSNRLFWY